MIPYHSHLLWLLNYVVLRALWKIDVYRIITFVNKSLYYYHHRRRRRRRHRHHHLCFYYLSVFEIYFVQTLLVVRE